MAETSGSTVVDFDRDIEIYAGEVDQFRAGAIPADRFKALAAARGVYEQRESGTYMLRVRLTGGVLTGSQGRLLARLGKRYANGPLHVTTRQNAQFHGLQLGDTPDVMRELRRSGLSSKGGGGNTVRTVVTCAHAGVCPAEVFDVTPHAEAISAYLLALPGSYSLPRKFKIACSGCSADCALAKVTDLGYVAEVRDALPGFALYCGGGMGAQSRVGDRLDEWIPATDALRAAEAARRLFDRLGDRTNRARARLRFAVERVGTHGFREAFQREFATTVVENVPVCRISSPLQYPVAETPPRVEAATPATAGLRTIRERVAGRVSVPLHVPLGLLPAEDLEVLAGVAEAFSDGGMLRTTREQSIMLRSVSVGKLPALAGALQAVRTPVIPPSLLERFVVCTGARICRLGLCWPRGMAAACADAVKAAGLEGMLDDTMVHISGCPNACGQHPLGAIGLCGAVLRHEDRSLPAYRISLGGAVAGTSAVFGKPIGIVPARAVPAALVALLRDGVEHRCPGESFMAYVGRQSPPHFAALLEPHRIVPSYAENPDYYGDWGAALSS